jgi:hypothetical protein
MSAIILCTLFLLSPSFKLGNGLNVSLADVGLPLLILFYFLKSFSKEDVKLKFTQINLIKIIFIINLFLIFLFTLSTVNGFFIFQDKQGFLKSLLQFYRRANVFLLVPLIVMFANKRGVNLSKFYKWLTYGVIISGLFGLLVNFSPMWKSLYCEYISSSKQILLPGIYRNMGTIGEASYFADILFFAIVLNLYRFNLYSGQKWAIAVLVFMLISTFSKSVVISSLFVSCLYIVIACFHVLNKKAFKLKKNKAIIIFSFLLLSPVVLIGVIKCITLLLQHSDIQLLIEMAHHSFQTRTDEIWKKSLSIMLDTPDGIILGLGFKGLKSYFGIAGAHNMYLASVIDFGIFIGLFFLIVYFFLFPLLFYYQKKSWLMLILSVFLMVQSIVHDPIYHYQVLGFYILIMCVFALPQSFLRSELLGRSAWQGGTNSR